MARKAKAKTRAEQMAENIERLVRERDEARNEADYLRAVCVDLREDMNEHAEDAKRWRKRARRDRETCDRLRFALDVVRERDALRAAKGGAS